MMQEIKTMISHHLYLIMIQMQKVLTIFKQKKYKVRISLIFIMLNY